MAEGGWKETGVGVMPGIFHGVVGVILLALMLLLIYVLLSPLLKFAALMVS